MRLSEWRAAAPNKDAGSTKVPLRWSIPSSPASGGGGSVLGWVVWARESGVRYSILVRSLPA